MSFHILYVSPCFSMGISCQDSPDNRSLFTYYFLPFTNYLILITNYQLPLSISESEKRSYGSSSVSKVKPRKETKSYSVDQWDSGFMQSDLEPTPRAGQLSSLGESPSSEVERNPHRDELYARGLYLNYPIFNQLIFKRILRQQSASK